MKKILQIVFFFLISIAVFAQEKKDSLSKAKASKWSVGISGGGTYTTKTKPYDDIYFWYYDAKIKYIIKYNIDVSIGYNLLRNTKLSGGCNYSTLEYESSGWAAYINANRNGIHLTYHYSFLNAYVLFKQALEIEKINFYIGIGPQLGIFNNGYLDFSIMDNQNLIYHEITERFTKHHTAFEGKFIFSVEYRFHKRISTFIESAFIKSIIGIKEKRILYPPPFGTSAGVEYKYEPNYYSFNIGILYTFKNK